MISAFCHPPAATLHRCTAFTITAVALALAGLGGCSVFKSNEEAQAIITQKVAAMPAGDFFQTYGKWRTRSELPTGSTAYDWESSIGSAPPGPYGLDERVCRLRIIVDKAGRIDSAVVVLDNPGRTSTSRCGEMFKAR